MEGRGEGRKEGKDGEKKGGRKGEERGKGRKNRHLKSLVSFTGFFFLVLFSLPSSILIHFCSLFLPHLTSCLTLSADDNGTNSPPATQAAKPTTNFLHLVSCPFNLLFITLGAIWLDSLPLKAWEQGASNLLVKFHFSLVFDMPEAIYMPNIFRRKKKVSAFLCIYLGESKAVRGTLSPFLPSLSCFFYLRV